MVASRGSNANDCPEQWQRITCWRSMFEQLKRYKVTVGAKSAPEAQFNVPAFDSQNPRRVI
jgi:hypothetical protein